MTWSLILHGGAKNISESRSALNEDGCLKALNAAIPILASGGTAVDAVEACIRSLEDHPAFNAGRGSVRRVDGSVQMDAALMEGAALNIGAVGAIEGVLHPISIARALLHEAPTLLVGSGARAFAAERQLEPCDPAVLIESAGTTSEACDTVGCVALDLHRDIAAGTSTGGLPHAWNGRIGDSPIPGCGFYADNGAGGVSISGDGEYICRSLLGGAAIGLLRLHHPQQAAEHTIRRLERVGGEAGVILMDMQGRCGWDHNSENFAVGWASGEDPNPQVSLGRIG